MTSQNRNPAVRLLIALLLAPLAPLQAADAGRPTQPNIIVVLADDVGLSRISCYGGEPFKTPHLDQLAATGLRFERCYSMPLCGPSRAALLTGKYPFRTGATSNGNSEIGPAAHPTMPAILHRAGYATCAIGKLGQSAPPDDADAPKRLGFDESMLWMGRATPDRYWNPRYYRNGRIVQGKPDQYGPDLTHDFLVDFMKRHHRRPFFIYYSAVLAHGPFVRTPDSKDGKNLVVDMVAYLDKQMGRLVADLEQLQLRDNTIILFTSDNGPYGQPLGAIRGKPMLGAKGDLAEGGVREPLIVNWPAHVAPGRVCRDLADFTDFFPTVLELAGVESPADVGLDGRSIAPQILGNAGRPRDWVYAQVGKECFIADHRFKLYGNGTLVDIRESPVAENAVDNSDPQAAIARRRLQEALDQLRAGRSEPTIRTGPLPLRAEAGADLQADVRLLVQHKMIPSTELDFWMRGAIAGRQVDGSRVAELMIAVARHFKPAASLDEAIAILKQEGIISAVDYWKQHAIAGERCTGANVARLINKCAQKQRTK